MPLNTEIKRGGRRRRIRWGGFHVAAMLVAIMFETKYRGSVPNSDLDYPNDPQPISPSDVWTLVDYSIIGDVCPDGKYKLEQNTKFKDSADSEVFEFKAGDELSFWRSHKDD